MNRSNRFVNDGCRRARAAMAATIRAEVLAEYAQRADRRKAWARLLLCWEMQREIRRRISRVAPADALY